MKIKKIIIITLVLVVLGSGGYYIYKNNFRKNVKGTQDSDPILVSVEKGNIKSTVSTSGLIESANYLAVTTSVNGIVKEVYVNEGDSVTKGQKIMEITLDSDGEESLASAWSSYLSAKNALEKAKTGLIDAEASIVRTEQAFDDEKKQNSYQSDDEKTAFKLAESDYQSAQANYENQKQSVTQAQASLNKAWLSYQAQSPTITAPGDGIISNIVVVEGMDISNSLSEKTSATVASIKKEGSPIASLDVSESDITKVKVGQTVELALSSNEDLTFTGEVVGIDKIGEVSSGVSNYPVMVKFNEDSEFILPNMGVDAEIIIEEASDVLYVPTSAVNEMGKKTVVMVLNGEEEQPVEVETGISNTDYTEILSGLKEGDQITVQTLPTSGFTSSSSEEKGPGGGMIMGAPGGGGGR